MGMTIIEDGEGERRRQHRASDLAVVDVDRGDVDPSFSRGSWREV